MSDNKIYFKFDGKRYGGNEGDTIASALLRNNIKLVGRSFKYHRPRGIYTCGIEEPNALVQVINEHNEPNVRATVKKIYDGMVIKSQNRWPSLKRDFGSIKSLQKETSKMHLQQSGCVEFGEIGRAFARIKCLGSARR